MNIAFDAPATGTIANATTEWPSAEMVHAFLIKAVATKCPLTLGILDDRKLIIERIAADQTTVLSAASYVMPQHGDRDRVLEFEIDVAVYRGAAVRARMDGCDAGETQWVVINYDFTK